MKAEKEWEKYSSFHVLFKANDASIKPKTRMISITALTEECTMENVIKEFVRKYGTDKAAQYSPTGGVSMFPCVG